MVNMLYMKCVAEDELFYVTKYMLTDLLFDGFNQILDSCLPEEFIFIQVWDFIINKLGHK